MGMMIDRETTRISIEHNFASRGGPLKRFLLPQSGDQLFCSDDSSHTTADLRRNRDQYYEFGYIEAGDALVRLLEDCNNGSFQDMLVFPIVFLYRHYTELTLKWIIIEISVALNKKSRWKKGHDVFKLWKTFRELLEEYRGRFYNGKQENSELLDAIGHLIEELQIVDPGSDAFRYHIDRKGKVTLPNIKNIGLANLADRFEAISNFFNGYRDELCELRYGQQEQ